ncbi:sugar phosphate isomerase/epimerase family protein [Vallitalea okinawensis]|uniref:sugar phosphate isomerase/epimerase family protein n=1 Tax=Vallitalea okinawensis TaxID=2078660 RepID=UPI000CFB80ED|nr:sugar phosphate isomerase/epimerase [Vallitalea okinawensis]
MNIQIAVQLYTLRNECKEDFTGMLHKVKDLGFKGVEFAGFFDTDANVLKEILNELDLYPVSSHIGMKQLENNFEDVIDYHKVIGCKNLVVPYCKFETLEATKELAKRLIEISKQLKPHDMKLLYHNHAHEFVEINGQYALDLLFQETSGYLEAEIDTHWVRRAEINPLDYLSDHEDLIKLIHIKDMLVKEDGSYDFEAVGHGIMDIKSIIKKADAMGIKWAIVENDDPVPNGLDNISKSIAYLKNEMRDIV